MTNVDAAIMWPNGKLYFFDGPQYYAYDIQNEKVDDGYPKSIAQYWPGLGNAAIQGAMVWPTTGVAYFFSGDQYYQYNIRDNKVDDGYPMPTRLKWRGVMAGPFNDYRIDVALAWPNGKAYLFQQDRYYAFGLDSGNVLPGYPRMIEGNWPKLWVSGIRFTAGFIWPKPVDGTTKAYFFQRSLYYRYDLQQDQAESGYPLPIQGNWRGL